MKKMSVDEIKKSANDILRYIKKVCDENSIVFYLAFGTALGAIRHEGFIPWDDDIDIYMTRYEYNKFKTVMKTYKNSHYSLLDTSTDKKYMLPLPKVVDNRTVVEYTNQNKNATTGVWVDIFVLDSVPEDFAVRQKYIHRLEIVQRKWYFLQYKRDYSKNTILGNIKTFCYWVICRLASPRIYAKRLDVIAQVYNNSKTTLVGNMQYSGINREKTIVSVDVLGNGRKCTFENEEYNCPDKIDDYLKSMYGDYMTLPPFEKRVSKHSIKAFYR